MPHPAQRAAALAAALLATAPALAQTRPAAPVRIVAAENFYGDLAARIAGPDAAVTSILSRADEDPHLFEASPAVARDLASADIAVANGLDYDPWMAKLLAASPRPARRTIVVADLLARHPGDNPHLWYDPAVMPAFARALAADLSRLDPAHAAEYDARLAQVLDSLRPLSERIAALRTRLAGTPVTATEPVFGDMADALGLRMRNARFQLAVMNDTEPAASDVAAFEDDLRQHRVRLLIYNSQATDTAARRLLDIAHAAGIPVLGVTETEPADTPYPRWMLAQLDALDHALSTPAPSP
ncbi:MAG: metal ABC transporter solute-binding protein, Zn/Mn family [Janthinobacterium lividum]